jgi:hypothetical protein
MAVLRVALLSDTHGFVDPRVLEEVRACDRIVHAGDVGAARVLDALTLGETPPVAVRGNNDTPARWPATDHPRLAALSVVAELALPGGMLVVVHGDWAGAPRERHPRLRRAYPTARVVVYGHSHRAVIDREFDPWVVNPGAAGRARTYGGPSYLCLTASPVEWLLELRRFPPGPVRAGSYPGRSGSCRS